VDFSEKKTQARIVLKRVTILAALASCATPYQRMGFMGGYSDRKIGPMTHSIDVQVNGYTSAGTALEYAYRRAGELCPDGYVVLNALADKSSTAIVNGNTVNEIDKPEVALIVQCKEQEIVKSVAPRRDIVRGSNALYCTSVADIETCYVTNEGCDQLATSTPGAKPCREQTSGACFQETVIVSDARVPVCAPTIDDCEQLLSAARNSADVADLPDRCSIYRQRADEGGDE